MTNLLVALAGGVAGSVLTAAFTQVAKARIASGEVSVHDDEADEYNAQLVAWVDDETRKLVAEMTRVTDDHNARGGLHSGAHRHDLADRKAGSLHRYRDEEWRVRLALSRLRAAEGTRHLIVRKRRGLPPPGLTARETVEPFLERWREPVTRHGAHPTDAVEVFDPTTRTTARALTELARVPLS